MTARVLEVHPAAAEVMVDAPFLRAPGIGPVLEPAALDAAEDGVELLLAHEEGVVLHLDFHPVGVEEVERHLVADLDAEERAERLGLGKPEQAREETRGLALVQRMDNRVVELYRHGGIISCCRTSRCTATSRPKTWRAPAAFTK